MISKQSSNFDVNVNNSSNIYGQLAIQGPKARHLVNEHTDVDVSDMSMFEFKQDVKFFDKNIILSQIRLYREDGFEIYCKSEDTVDIWNQLLEYDVVPCGLGARDTLRLEAGLPLHGQDLTESITPYEGGIALLLNLLLKKNLLANLFLKIKKKMVPLKELLD